MITILLKHIIIVPGFWLGYWIGSKEKNKFSENSRKGIEEVSFLIFGIYYFIRFFHASYIEIIICSLLWGYFMRFSKGD